MDVADRKTVRWFWDLTCEFAEVFAGIYFLAPYVLHSKASMLADHGA